MRIRDIDVIGLIGATPEGGWSNELRPEDSVHSLVIVHTSEGVDGIGGAFTNAGLVRAAIAVLEPLWRGEIRSSRSGSAKSCTSTRFGWDAGAR